VYDELLSQVRLTQPGESAELTRLLVHVERFLRDYPDENSTVYLMSGGRTRQRGVREGKILNLFQGRNPLSGTLIYPGDRLIRAPEGLTVQVHTLKLTDGDSGNVLAENVPVLAVWVPSPMARPVLRPGPLRFGSKPWRACPRCLSNSTPPATGMLRATLPYLSPMLRAGT